MKPFYIPDYFDDADAVLYIIRKYIEEESSKADGGESGCIKALCSVAECVCQYYEQLNGRSGEEPTQEQTLLQRIRRCETRLLRLESLSGCVQVLQYTDPQNCQEKI